MTTTKEARDPAQEPAAWQWRYVGGSEWCTPSGGRKITEEELKRERPIEQRPLFPRAGAEPQREQPELTTSRGLPDPRGDASGPNSQFDSGDGGQSNTSSSAAAGEAEELDETDILPCPFCGAAPFVEPTGFHLGGRTIRCESDDCMGPHTTAANVNDAVVQWSRRAQTPQRFGQKNADEDEAYEIGKRDGYEDAVQELDIFTGGDGEFKGSTLPGGTVDVPAMMARIKSKIGDAMGFADLRASGGIFPEAYAQSPGDTDDLQWAEDKLNAALQATDTLRAERDAALAQVERLKASLPRLVDWTNLYATEGQSWLDVKVRDKLIELSERNPLQEDAEHFQAGGLLKHIPSTIPSTLCGDESSGGNAG